MVKKDEKMGLGGMLEIRASDGIAVQDGEIISSVIQRPGQEPEVLIYLGDTPLADILKESSRMAGLNLTEVQIEEYTKEVKEKGRIGPIKIGAGVSGQGGSFEVDIKSKGQIIRERKITIKYSK